MSLPYFLRSVILPDCHPDNSNSLIFHFPNPAIQLLQIPIPFIPIRLAVSIFSLSSQNKTSHHEIFETNNLNSRHISLHHILYQSEIV